MRMSSSESPTTLTGQPPHAGPSGEPLRLVVVEGPDLGKEIELVPGVYRIGKGEDAQLVLTDPQVSRNHLALHVSPNGVQVRDLGSKNGAYLAGVRLTEGVLYPGSDLRLGATRLRLVSGAAGPAIAPSKETRFGQLRGWSLLMRRVFTELERVAATDAPVLIEGETGCGKELCAHAIHLHGRRKDAAYVVCDLSAVTRNLIESELFGHERGAFTGADKARQGAFAAADHGTIFIDEIGELELGLQPRLLRALEAKQVKTVGGTQYRSVDFRVIAATNRVLEEEVRTGRFREDLFYRLAVARVRLPPLRERKEDVPHLAHLFLEGTGLELPPESLALLEAYDWPGNVRELRNVLDSGVARLGASAGKELTPRVLGLSVDGGGPELPWPAIGAKDFATARDALLGAWERNFLEALLKRCEGNISRASREGGIERVYLHRLLKRHKLAGKDFK